MKEILAKLAQHRSTPSVSMIIPSELNSFADKEKLAIKLKENVIKVEKQLHKQYGEASAKAIGESLRSLVDAVDTNTLTKGIGFFVSEEIAEKVNLPFSVVERNVIANRFDIADIEEAIKLLAKYEVLVLSRKESRLFAGSGEKLSLISDDVFPVAFEDDFQVKRPGQHSFYNSEETKINQARVDSYFRKIDKALSARDSKTPLVIIGTIENLSDFKHIKKCKQPIVGKVHGNMDHISISEIGKKAWSEIAEYMTDRQLEDYQNTLLKVVKNIL